MMCSVVEAWACLVCFVIVFVGIIAWPWTGGDSSCVSVLSFLISVWVVLRCCIGNRSHYLTTIQCSFIMTTPSPLQLSNPPLSPISFPYRDFLFLLSYHSNRITPLINHFFFSSSSSFLRISLLYVSSLLAFFSFFFANRPLRLEKKEKDRMRMEKKFADGLCFAFV